MAYKPQTHPRGITMKEHPTLTQEPSPEELARIEGLPSASGDSLNNAIIADEDKGRIIKKEYCDLKCQFCRSCGKGYREILSCIDTQEFQKGMNS